MVPIKFTSLVLGLLLVLQALRVSLTQAHQDRAMNGNGLAMTGENVLLVKKGLLDGKPNAVTRTRGLGGRKMVVDRVSRKGIEEQGLNQENSKISGKDNYAWEKFARKSRYPPNDQPNSSFSQPQDNLNTLEPKTWKCSSLGCTSKSKIPVSQEPPDTTQRDEEERLLKAVNEMVNLIHKDYKGTDKPKRKPPINNHEPSD
ncbi:uncharacterized protein LOC117930409 isoform X1 [Vitis riparia]|uniref:uncharacterized protein LOC117930409 isoform X1 n=1 Tax=Vitis riparia TaxID=96939 RepID=UPI00155B253D|nr:uncharacterized protein LOC117930409 isoform X1 [Vitis riparia]